jgi:hypothetical protein
MEIIDQGEKDDKIVCVHIDDPEYKEYTNIDQFPKHILEELQLNKLSFFIIFSIVLIFISNYFKFFCFNLFLFLNEKFLIKNVIQHFCMKFSLTVALWSNKIGLQG